jgi:hypothetical protein
MIGMAVLIFTTKCMRRRTCARVLPGAITINIKYTGAGTRPRIVSILQLAIYIRADRDVAPS